MTVEGEPTTPRNVVEGEPTTPRNVVENPILNSPFAVPQYHYDFSGPSPKRITGRRAAGYHGTVRTERMGEGAIASHAFFPLPLVNEIRSRVNAWRERGYPGVTNVTRDLLDHWNRPDRRPMFFCQREAVETIIWLVEGSVADRQGLDIPVDAPGDLESLSKRYRALTRYCAKMATGSGKTAVMAMIASWSIINKGISRQDARFTDRVLVMCPNLTIRERLSVLDPRNAGNYYESFDLVPSSYRDVLSRGRVFATNWHAFLVQDDANRRGIVQRGRESDGAFVGKRLRKDLPGDQPLLVLNDEAHHAYRPGAPTPDQQLELDQLGADERGEVEELAEAATVWVGGLDRINATRGIRFVVDLSATPFFIKASGRTEGAPFPWITSDFGLVDAIESGITKVPRIPVGDDSGRPDPKYFHLWREIQKRLPASEKETQRRKAKPDAVWREAQGALTTLAGKWKKTFDQFEASKYPVPPTMIVVAANTALAAVIADAVKNGDVIADLAGEHSFRIDSKVLAAAEAAEEGGSRDDERERLRMKTATVGKATWPGDVPPEGWNDVPEPPGKNVRCVVSVGMLTEGWDAQNVTQILGLRAFSSQLLCEQVVGRGLRRMNYELDPTTGLLTPEYCDVFGVPFEVIPVQGSATTAPAPALPASTLVQALEERKPLAIEFPRVEGFIFDVKERVRCDVDKVPPLTVEPQVEPTAVVIRSQLGWAIGKSGLNTTTGPYETLTREQFYAEHRPQGIAFDITRDIIEVLAGGKVSMGKQPDAPQKRATARMLFPQVRDIVTAYMERRIVLAGAARIEEVALAMYRDIIVERLLTAIEPDAGAGEPTVLPRIEQHRPMGSTDEVQFRTTKPSKGTLKSHISHVVLDSNVWEGAAAFHLEQTPWVTSYVKNDRLDFEILYEWQGRTVKYVPDFLVRADVGGEMVTLILEMKGHEDEQDRAKTAAAERWVKAVNNHGGFGRWDYLVVNDPNAVPAKLASWRERAARARRESTPPARA